MKIGILTLPLHTNYGGILQAYALQTVLERMGHEVVVIDKIENYHVNKIVYPFIILYRIIKKVIFKDKNVQVFRESYGNKIEPIVRKNTNIFINKYIKRLEVYKYSEITQTNQFDAIIVGSDQVWRPLYNSNIEDYFIGFDEYGDFKRIAYAASFGISSWEFDVNQTQKCSSLLKKFNAVSVREFSGADLCSNYFNVRAKVVLDPTLLLNKYDYIHLIDLSENRASELKLFNYILDLTPVKQKIIDKISNEVQMKPFTNMAKLAATRGNYRHHLEDCISPSVTSWIKSFYDSDLVVTDSFHGCVFSIIFNKPFWVILNKERGTARFDTLLSIFNLKNRIVDINKINSINWKDKINWLEVNEILKMKQQESFDFLIKNLKV